MKKIKILEKIVAGNFSQRINFPFIRPGKRQENNSRSSLYHPAGGNPDID